ncbi:recombinase family protein [Methylobacterium platani]|uniref:Resolvase n=2 Tax=Methylobacterium platani TaxID=427683 RepID=A0A179S3L1_9HYPH|nr:recombinase family protein [Methylobacterium platani]KMO21621.1 resolvase [Methylobacterium platani JCM 14648]OAS19106.1 resolvase [Methylobacterium platani]
MARGGFVTYTRVSTDRQGKSGLGLEAQRDAVRTYLNGGKWHIIAEFVEVESGRNDARPALDEALAAARLHRAPLVVAKVDRLTRSVAFLTKILSSGVDVRFCDLPQVEGPAGRFMLNQMVAVAELEAGLISDRTKAALKAARARGVKLGGNRGSVVTDAAREAGRAAGAARARSRAADLAPTIAALKAEDITSASGIAAALNAKGIPAARGGEWQAIQVQRLLARLGT